MATTLTTELSLIKPTPGTHEPYTVANMNTNSNTIDATFNSTTGHDHSGAHKGAPIPTAGITALAVTGAKIAAATVTADKLSLGQLTNSLGANVSLNNTGLYFDGPSVAQGVTGTWFASGSVTLHDTAGGAAFNVKLWDGTTVIAACQVQSPGASQKVLVSLSGYLATPAANIKISAQDATSTSGVMVFNTSGTSKDCTLSVFRIA